MLGVADDCGRLEFIILPHSSVICKVKSGNWTRLSFFRIVPLPTVVAIDIDDPAGVIVLHCPLLSDAINGIGVAGRNLSIESNMVSTESLSGVADIGRRSFCKSSAWLVHSAPMCMVVVGVVSAEPASIIGLIEHELRLNTGDGVKFPKLDGEFNRFKLLLVLLLLVLFKLALVLEVLQFIAVG